MFAVLRKYFLTSANKFISKILDFINVAEKTKILKDCEKI